MYSAADSRSFASQTRQRHAGSQADAARQDPFVTLSRRADQDKDDKAKNKKIPTQESLVLAQPVSCNRRLSTQQAN